MKKCLRIVFLLLIAPFWIQVSLSSSGQKSKNNSYPHSAVIQTAYQQGLIDYETMMLYEFLSIVDPERIPSGFKAMGGKEIHKCLTPVIDGIRRNINLFSPENRKIIMEYFFEEPPAAFSKGALRSYKTERSGGFDFPNVRTTDNFAIRWGDRAYDPDNEKGIDPTDSDANGYPDLIDKWAKYLEESWKVEVEDMKLKKPKKSDSYLLDVYIDRTSDSKKFGLGSGDYAYTTTYSDGTAYLVVNNFLPDEYKNDDPEGQEIGAIKVTAAHEFCHTIQFAYDRNEVFWWQEATATWMEDEVFDEVNDYYQYLQSDGIWVSEPETSLIKNNGGHKYGDVIWVKYLSQYHGGRGVFKNIWKLCKKYSALTANKTFFKKKGTNLRKAYKDFSAKNVTMDFSYTEGDNYGAVSEINWHDSYPVSEKIEASDFFTPPPSYLGANYIKFSNGNGDVLKITFNGHNRYKGKDIKWGAVVVEIDSSGEPNVRKIKLNSNNKGSININGFGSTYEEVYLVVSVLTNGPKKFSDGVPYKYSAELK